MPLYEYKCRKCGHTFEIITTFGADNPGCPRKCGDKTTQCEGGTDKLISRGSFALKGGGWYKDGY